MSLWQLRWYLVKNEDVKYKSWRERLHLPVWLFISGERTPRAAASMKRVSDSSLTPIFFRTPRPKRTNIATTHTLAALAVGPITTIGNPPGRRPTAHITQTRTSLGVRRSRRITRLVILRFAAPTTVPSHPMARPGPRY